MNGKKIFLALFVLCMIAVGIAAVVGAAGPLDLLFVALVFGIGLAISSVLSRLGSQGRESH